jgi:D-serine deaminase-like pyridoxal phosphate-dependent protein
MGRTPDQPAVPSSVAAIDREAIERLRSECLPPGTKGLPLSGRLFTLDDLATGGLNLLGDKLPLPVLTLGASALTNNIAVMADYCRERDILLAPHGKTTMAPQLFQRQIDAGCWALTAATPTHLALYRAFGVGRIFYANQLVERSALRWLAAELRGDAGFDFYCLVDSEAGTHRMAAFLDDEPLRAPVNILIEIGHKGGRGGCRTVDDALSVARAVHASPKLRLVGLEAFEGTLAETPRASETSSPTRRVAEFLELVAGSARALSAAGLLPDDAIVSAGGSAFFDVVADAMTDLRRELPHIRAVLRAGSYITHDGGFYEELSPFGRRTPTGGRRLRSALELWSVILSRPQPDLAIMGAGKRDAPIDLGLPVPGRMWSESRGLVTLEPSDARVVGVSDQHLHLGVNPLLALDVGDRVACAVSHPCTAFDKWSVILVVDDDLNVVDAVRTFF